MTYYGTQRGAKVFAAGAFLMPDFDRHPEVKPVMENLWTRLAVP